MSSACAKSATAGRISDVMPDADVIIDAITYLEIMPGLRGE